MKEELLSRSISRKEHVICQTHRNASFTRGSYNENARALPLLPNSDLSFGPQQPSSCSDLGHCRTIWDIVWSCLVVIFTCNWVAIHPNIPGPDESILRVTLRRAGIMTVALIAPELVIMWASRQWIVAREYERKYKARDWTMTHGFFALMGGFMLFDGDSPQRILLPDDIDQLVKNGEIEFPYITREEINDKSKGDLISKGLVIVQTTWFILQCTARGVERLPVTELEVVTLAYAILTFATYAIWWNKPLNVQRSVRIYKKSAGGCVGASDDELNAEVEAGECGADGVSSFFGEEESKALLARGGSYSHAVGQNKAKRFLAAFVHRIVTSLRGFSASRASSRRELISDTRRALEGDTGHWSSALLARVYTPFLPFIYMGGMYSDIQPGAMKVPTYHVGTIDDDLPIFCIVGAIATIFGAMHCIAWSFEFPSFLEQYLWRASSLAVTCIPFAEVLVQALLVPLPNSPRTGKPTVDRVLDFLYTEILHYIVVLLFVTLSLAYIFARIDLLIQAFISLRALPPGAYNTVHWTTFIPHI